MVRPGVTGSGGAVGPWLEWERAGVRSGLPLNRPLVIGRDASSDIRVADQTVSRRHAVVALVDGQAVVDATGSANGINFGGGRVAKIALSLGQSFRIGDTEFRFVPVPSHMAQAAPAQAGAQTQAMGMPAPQPVVQPIQGSWPGAPARPNRPPAGFRGAPAPSRANKKAIVIGIVSVAVVAVVALAGLGVLVLTRSGSGGSDSLGLAAASLDPAAPAFPVPAGSTLLNAQIDGSGAGAYRLAAWQSGSDYDKTAAFYTGLSDSRWQASGSASTTPQATDLSFADGSGVFASAEVTVSRTDPVKIEVRLLSKTSPAAQSFGPGPTIAFGPLPAASALPDGFPSALVPPGTTLKDAGAIGTTYFALFSGSVDVGAYETQIKAAVTITNTHTESGATVIDFTLGGKPGQIVIDPAGGEVSVEVTK
jgi:hypothetical protein